MPAPNSIRNKVEQLQKALDKVSILSYELEQWYAKKTDDDAAHQFFYECRLDVPYEFDYYKTMQMLDDAADGYGVGGYGVW